MSVDDTSDFTKQRRNLMIISTILWLHDILGIQYKDFKIFEMEITKPENLSWLIWVFWGYFLLRYFNLFFEQNRRYKNFIHTTYQNQVHKHYCKKFEKKHPEINGSFNVNQDFKKFLSHHLTYVHPHDRSKNITYHINLKIFYFYLNVFIISLWRDKAFFEYYFPIFFAFSPVILFFYNHFVSS